MVILERDFPVRKRKEDDAMDEPPSSDLTYRSPMFAVVANDGRILFVALRYVAFVFCFVLLSSLCCFRIGHISFCSYGVAKESIAPRGNKCHVVGRSDFSSSIVVSRWCEELTCSPPP